MEIKENVSEETFTRMLNTTVKYYALLGIILNGARYTAQGIRFDDRAIDEFLKEYEPEKHTYITGENINEKNR